MEKVWVRDVGPRDGLQNQSQLLSPTQRRQLVQALLDAGLSQIEVGAFVSPRAVPAMAGSDQVLAGLTGADAEFSVLIPNEKGYDLALAAGARHVAIVVASSETMNKKNIGMDNQQAFDFARLVLRRAQADGVYATCYIATAWECPFEGAISSDTIARQAEQLHQYGAREIVLADTIGAATPEQVADLSSQLCQQLGSNNLACHFHDTRGMGVANAYAALCSGVRRFDASISGLGGCPFAPGASGNIATEDLVLMLNQQGYDTGISLAGLAQASELCQQLLPGIGSAKSYPWIRRQIEKGSIS